MPLEMLHYIKMEKFVLVVLLLLIMYCVCMYSYIIIIVTSDVQAVSATVVGESTIDIQCLFIHGSDALGSMQGGTGQRPFKYQ